jgi:type I restriction enzyme, S subunit
VIYWLFLVVTLEEPSLLILIPPQNEQNSIVKILDSHETRIRKEDAYLNKLKLQKQGLMQDLLT